MIVKIEDLRRAANLLFDHMERQGISSVTVDNDFYWDIPPEQLHSMYEEPNGLSVGQLSSDVAELNSIIAGEKQPLAFAFTWLASLLRYLGTKFTS